MNPQLLITLPHNELEAELLRRFPKARNPMVLKHGLGPIDKTCGDCALLERHVSSPNNTFFKCRLRGVSASSATDHRKSWPTCKQFVPIGEVKWSAMP